MDWVAASEESKKHGDSFFVFDENKFRSNFESLHFEFNQYYPHTRVGYSYKTNYTPYICKIVNELGGIAEVVSGMEYSLAKRVGVKGKHIIYNGPYKSDSSFREALFAQSIVNIDSMRDVEMLRACVLEHKSDDFHVSIRCNFALHEDSNSRFGMDINGEEFSSTIQQISKMSNVKLSGLHCHFPDRDLQSFSLRAQKLVDLAREIFPEEPPEFLNIGGGFFGEMPDKMIKKIGVSRVTFQDYAKVIGEIFTKTYGHMRNPPILYIEPGTALVANTFKFYTKVVSLKNIRSKQYATVAGSIFNISPIARSLDLPVEVLTQFRSLQASQKYNVVGYTCIEGDFLCKDLEADLSVDDFIVFGNVGSYSIVMKPPFILPNVAILVNKVSTKGFSLDVIKKAESKEYIFQNFVF